MMKKLRIDFETRSDVDLKKCGAYVYAQSKHTDILCMAFGIDDEAISVWKKGEELPKSIRKHIIEGGIVSAWNANFEFLIWNQIGVKRYGWPELKIEQVFCTMAQAFVQALPGSLENCALALGNDKQKDMSGKRVMMQLSRPRSIANDDPIFWEKEEAPDKFEQLYKYCIQDVEVERQIDKCLLPLSESERQIWLLDHKINSRGVQIDLPSVDLAIKIIESEKDRLDSEMRRVTKLKVASSSSVAQLIDWIKDNGVEAESASKEDVKSLLSKNIPANVRRVLEIRQEAAKSSTAKLNAMVLRSNADGKVRGTLQFHGAATGRWAGRGIQIQNLPRPKLKQELIESAIADLHKGSEHIDMFYGAPMSVLSDCIRGMITASPGNILIAADFSAIEARVLAWLAGEQKILDIFSSHGKIYEAAASDIYRVPIDKVTKDQRQIGKVAVLALGYQGGKGAFQSMASIYGVKVSDAKADEIKNSWREANQKIVKYWYALEQAAVNAVKFKGMVFEAGANERQVRYKCSGSFLICKLPSGRCIYYPFPTLEDIETPWGSTKIGVTYMGEDSVSKRWSKQKLYGGLLSENVTQAVARDILAEAMLRAEDNGYQSIMTIHDEIVCEFPKTLVTDKTEKSFENLVTVLPKWAKGLPMAAEAWIGNRYKK